MTRCPEWLAVCGLADVPPGHGVAALLPGGAQLAVFHTVDGELYALSNIDPYSRAAVLSRGILGDIAGEPVVASPVYKNRFALRTGKSLDTDGVTLRCYRVRVVACTVQIGLS